MRATRTRPDRRVGPTEDAAGRGPTAKAFATALVLLVSAGSTSAETLSEALGQAYETNPTLRAARVELRSVNEGVPEALSARRPSLQGNGQAGADWTDTDLTDASTRTTPRTIGIEATQPLYRGGRIDAGVQQAERLVRAQRAALSSTEQSTLLDAASAYLNVVRDQAVVELNKNLERVLARQLEATQDRFRVGEITRTDVSQAESRLAGATASRIQAEGTLETSRANYARIIGQRPAELRQPSVEYTLPDSLDEAIALAEENNPSVVAAVFTEQAAQSGVRIVDGELYPTADLTASYTYSREVGRQDARSRNAQVIAQVTVPLYTSGSVAARARAARETANQRRIEVQDARRQARESAVASWQQLVTARASIVSLQAQVRAAEIALEGVRQEELVGARTVLDTLDAEQELLDARVNLVLAQRDEAVAIFTVLSAIGELTVQRLGLDVTVYDETEHYRAVRDRWFGIDIVD